ncbi:hypothetical protein AQF98_11770 [Pedobacter sp. Hv1]|nr:hypothetical protein AQF98_11770 [Pedobacter sp. Hv1]
MISFLFLFAMGVVQVRAQEEALLPLDEKGKLIYYEVVALKDQPKDSLQLRVFNYFKGNKSLKSNSAIGDSLWVAEGKMVVDKTLLVMSHPSGEILYRFYVEVKDQKYRFWISDFNFIPYQRDRYGNFVPSTPIGTPLEKDPGKLNMSQWKEYQLLATTFAKAFAVSFKQYMANKAPITIPIPVQKVVRKNW